MSEPTPQVRIKRWLFVCVVSTAALALPAASSDAMPSAAEARAVAVDVSRRLDAQDRLPSEDRQRNGGEQWDRGGAGAAPAGSGSVQTASPEWSVLFIVLGVIVAAGAAVFVFASVWQSFGGRMRNPGGDRDGIASPGPHAAAERGGLGSADELAAAGRYTEAMHQLLADALALVRRRHEAELPDALTSREILRALSLHVSNRDALRDMIARVEQTWFAKRSAASGDYEAVRASFHVFTGDVARA